MNNLNKIKRINDYFKIDAKDVFMMIYRFWKIKAKFGKREYITNWSIDKFIGKDYSRVRIGIGHPKQKRK